MSAYFYETPIGAIGIAEKDGKITRLYFPTDHWSPNATIQETPLLQEAARQLQDYLAGKLTGFSLPLQPEGTAFMQQVWRKLCEIPYGDTVSYKGLAENMGKPNAASAILPKCAIAFIVFVSVPSRSNIHALILLIKSPHYVNYIS